MTDKPRTELTLEEAFNSITYHDQLVLEKEFGFQEGDPEKRPLSLTRGMVWIMEKRTNPKATLAEVKAMGMKECGTYFASPDPDQTEESVSGQGKDSAPPVPGRKP
jgi:hypothetical protein